MDTDERFSRSEVKGQGHDQTKCYNGGGMHFEGVASRRTCLNLLLKSVYLVHFNILKIALLLPVESPRSRPIEYITFPENNNRWFRSRPKPE